jgi:hypothetical protein
MKHCDGWTCNPFQRSPNWLPDIGLDLRAIRVKNLRHRIGLHGYQDGGESCRERDEA